MNVIGLRPEPGGYGSQTMTGRAYRPDGWEAGVVCDSKANQGEIRIEENLLKRSMKLRARAGVSHAAGGCKASPIEQAWPLATEGAR